MDGCCIVAGAGEFTARGLAKGPRDLVIAADGGYAALLSAGVEPDLIVGDFDSLGHVPQDGRVLSFPPEKDDTDMALAAGLGWDRGYRRFRLYGGSGDRPDHFLANLQLLAALSRRGARAELVCPEYSVHALTDGELLFPDARAGVILSVFCQGERAEGVCLRGVKYPLEDAVLRGDTALGVSNAFSGGDARVSVAHGTLWVFVYLTRTC